MMRLSLSHQIHGRLPLLFKYLSFESKSSSLPAKYLWGFHFLCTYLIFNSFLVMWMCLKNYLKTKDRTLALRDKGTIPRNIFAFRFEKYFFRTYEVPTWKVLYWAKIHAESKKLDKTCPEPFGGKSGGWVLLQLIVVE